MDLLIAATALYNNSELITIDKELNKVLEKNNYISTYKATDGIIHLSPKQSKVNELSKRNELNGYINSSWLVKLKNKV